MLLSAGELETESQRRKTEPTSRATRGAHAEGYLLELLYSLPDGFPAATLKVEEPIDRKRLAQEGRGGGKREKEREGEGTEVARKIRSTKEGIAGWVCSWPTSSLGQPHLDPKVWEGPSSLGDQALPVEASCHPLSPR